MNVNHHALQEGLCEAATAEDTYVSFKCILGRAVCVDGQCVWCPQMSASAWPPRGQQSAMPWGLEGPSQASTEAESGQLRPPCPHFSLVMALGVWVTVHVLGWRIVTYLWWPRIVTV